MSQRRIFFLRALMLVTCLFVIAVHTIPHIHKLTRSYPHNPWESAQTVEAWRAHIGTPVYEPTPEGHATGFYGALWPHVLGTLYWVLPPNNLPGMILSMIAALGIGILAFAAFARGGRVFGVAWTAALLLAVSERAQHYFAANRPDVLALFVGLVGLIVCYRGVRTKYFAGYASGVALLAIGFFLKQTCAFLVPVLVVATLTERAFPWRRRLRWAATAPAVFALIFLILHFAFPLVNFYMVQALSHMYVDRKAAVVGTWELLRDWPLGWTLLFATLLVAPETLAKRRPRWLLIAVAILVPVSGYMGAKEGAAPNSLLPGLVALAAFALWALPRVWKAALDLGRPAAAVCLILVFLLTAWPKPVLNTGFFAFDPFQRAYRDTVEAVSNMPGVIVCPEDPTIPLLAKGQVGRNIFLEYDVLHFPKTMPDYLRADIRAADFVVDIDGWWSDPVDPAFLTSLGFRRQFVHGPYSIWSR